LSLRDAIGWISAQAIRHLSPLFIAFSAIVAAEPPPNVILPMSDDRGWGNVGFNGNSDIITPHLDAMPAAACALNAFTRRHRCACRPAVVSVCCVH